MARAWRSRFPGVNSECSVCRHVAVLNLSREQLIQQEILAKTTSRWVAYTYHAGLKGLSMGGRIARRLARHREQLARSIASAGSRTTTKCRWRRRVPNRGGGNAEPPVRLQRFHPPHNFFWAREIRDQPSGTTSTRKTATRRFVRRSTGRSRGRRSENQANFSLYARAQGSLQRHDRVPLPELLIRPQPPTMPATAFTHGDHYKPVAGYQVMNHHYHMDLGHGFARLAASTPTFRISSPSRRLGINIVSQIDSVGGRSGGDAAGCALSRRPSQWHAAAPVAAVGSSRARAARLEIFRPVDEAPGRGGNAPAAGAGRGRGDELQIRYNSIGGSATPFGCATFFVMPSQEVLRQPRLAVTRTCCSRIRVYWVRAIVPRKPLVDEQPKYGKVYHIGKRRKT